MKKEKKYSVFGMFESYGFVEVDAESEDAAEDIAKTMQFDEFEIVEHELIRIDSVEEQEA